MIKEVKMFTVICDNCGRDCFKDSEYSCWNEPGYAIDNALDCGWISHDGKEYCDLCFCYDESDTIEINSSRTKTIPVPSPQEAVTVTEVLEMIDEEIEGVMDILQSLRSRIGKTESK